MHTIVSVDYGDNGGNDAVHDEAATSTHKAQKYRLANHKYIPFFHHYQGSIDFNTVNIHRTVWVYFLIFPRSRDGTLSEMIFKDQIIQYTPCSLGSVRENTALGTVFSDTLPDVGNIRNTSSRGNIFNAPAMMQNHSM